MAAPCLAERRLRNELMSLVQNPTPGIEVCTDGVEENIWKWLININGAAESLYEGETFQLQFLFPDNYPFMPPDVRFVGPNIPLNPHVYSDGHICITILMGNWTAALTVESVCLSILSLLSSCTEKKGADHDEMFVRLYRKLDGKRTKKEPWNN